MPRKCKDGQQCRKYKGFNKHMEEKTFSVLQPLFVIGIILMFYIFYFRILKRRFHINNDNYRRKINNKRDSTKPIISLCLNDIVIKIKNEEDNIGMDMDDIGTNINTNINRDINKDIYTDININKKRNNGSIYLIESALEPFYKLCVISELFVIAQITNDKQEKNIIELFKSFDIFKKGLKEHRLMFCNTPSGRASMIRQLSPFTHLDNDEIVIKTLTGKIPNLVRIYESNKEPSESSNFTSLHAFTQVISAVANVEEIGRG